MLSEIDIKSDKDNWATVSEVASILGKSAWTVRRLCERGDLESRQVKGRGRGGVGLRIAVKSLGDDLRDELIERRAHKTLTRAYDGAAPKAKPAKKQQALRIVTPPHEARKPRIRRQIEAVRMLMQQPDDYTADDWATHVAKAFGASRATIWRWKAKHTTVRETGDQNEIRFEIPSTDNGVPIVREVRSRVFDRAFVMYAIGMYAERNGDIDMQMLYQATCDAAARNGWRFGELKTFYALMHRLFPMGRKDPLITIITGGRIAGYNRIAPAIRRDNSVYAPMEQIVGDQKIWDFQVWTEVEDESLANGKRDGVPVRYFQPQSYLYVDQRTWFIGGWTISDASYNKFDVAAALRMMCTYGLFTRSYNDNGSSETSEYFQQLSAELHGYGADMLDHADLPKLQTKARAYNARTKINERIHAALDRKIINEGVPGYCRRIDGEEAKVRRDRLNKQRRTSETLHLSQFFEVIRTTIEHWNTSIHQFDESAFAPKAKFFELLQHQPAPLLSADVLSYIFLPSLRYTVKQAVISANLTRFGSRFAKWGKLDYHDPALAEYNGQRVELRVDPLHPDRAFAIDTVTGRLICQPRLWEKINPKQQDQVRARLANQQRIVKAYEHVVAQARAEFEQHRPEKPVYAFAQGYAVAKDIKSAEEEQKQIDKSSNENLAHLTLLKHYA